MADLRLVVEQIEQIEQTTEASAIVHELVHIVAPHHTPGVRDARRARDSGLRGEEAMARRARQPIRI
ncbi:MAG: hypothetical protein H0T89_26070 [Deltaproteobacteria bacterium]|nr:hypothetical protein [Deltaproteobacteria bacterium]MDQ3297630.1 hypothetical protein [Myxococcota bacterium]